MAFPNIATTNLAYGDDHRNIKIFAKTESNEVIFTSENHGINPKAPAICYAYESEYGSTVDAPRIIIRRSDQQRADGTDRILIKRKAIWFFFKEDGTRVTTATDAATAIAEVVAYLATEFNRSIAEDVEGSGFNEYDLHVVESSTSATPIGSALNPFSSIQDAIDVAEDGDRILVKGDFRLSTHLVLPSDRSLHFFGAKNTIICYPTYVNTNGMLAYQSSSSCTKEYSFDNIKWVNAGSYALYIRSAAKVEITNCEFFQNGWSGLGLSTILAEDGGTLGYDSAQVDLQAFWAGTETSNGGAMRIRSTTVVKVTDCDVHNNLRGMRIQDCGAGGYGYIARNQCYNNIESGIYLASGPYNATGGCENFTVYNNSSKFNANNGMLVIGGINNVISLNVIEGNWNAGVMGWHVSNTRFRDMDLNDNNRSALNGIGSNGDAHASISIAGGTINPGATYLVDILDTQVYNSGLGANTSRVGLRISSDVSNINDRSISLINIDDVGFVGQDYALETNCDLSKVRVTIGDCRYIDTAEKNVLHTGAGSHFELPFSNHSTSVKTLDVVVDTIKMTVALCDGVGGDTVNVYGINELQSINRGTFVDVIQKGSKKVQLSDLTYPNVYVNGVVAGSDVNSMNDTMNAAFEMSLMNYKTFLESEVGVNTSGGGGSSLPAQADNWYIAYGVDAEDAVTDPTVTATYKGSQPFYNGDFLEKGHEYIWTHSDNGTYILGVWSGAETTYDEVDVMLDTRWSTNFKFSSSTNTVRETSIGVDVASRFASGYDITNNTVLCLRYGNDGYLYLLDITGGEEVTVGRSNVALVGDEVTIFMGGANQPNAKFPVMQERTERWTVVADLDDSENGEWSDGIETQTIIKSNMSILPNEKFTFTLPSAGHNRYYALDYTGTSIGESNPVNDLENRFRWHTTEILQHATTNGWTMNSSNSYYDTVNYGGQWNPTHGNQILVSWRHLSDNTLEMWDEDADELIMTLNSSTGGAAVHMFFGANAYASSISTIPVLSKYNLDAVAGGTNVATWFFIESPDGNFEYPLFRTEAEANAIDLVEGGSGSSSSKTYDDDLTNTTWYYPDTNFVSSGTVAPSHGIWGGSTSIVWNEQVTDVDTNYAPTFTDIQQNVMEGSSVNIVYKAAGDTHTYNVTGVPSGYADNGTAIIGTAETITDGIDIQHVLNVTMANNYGSDTGTITIDVLNDVSNDDTDISIGGSDTPFTKAMSFDGSNDYLRANPSSSQSNPLYMYNQSGGTTVNPGEAWSNSQPWTVSVWFRCTDSNTANERAIWTQGNTAGGVMLTRKNGKLNFKFGSTSNNLEFTSTDNINTDEWYGINIQYDGGLTGSSSSNVNDYYSRFIINRVMATGAVSEVQGTWTHSNYGFNDKIDVYFYVGQQFSAKYFMGEVAACTASTLPQGVALLTDEEIAWHCNNPKKFMEDVMTSRLWRKATYNNASGYVHNNANTHKYVNSLWCGDGIHYGNPETWNSLYNQGYTNTSGSVYKWYSYNMSSADLVSATPED